MTSSPRRTTIAAIVLAAAAAALVLLIGARGLDSAWMMSSQTRDVPAFNAVDLTGANVVNISVGHSQSVRLRGGGDQLRRVTTTVHGGVLAIGTKGSLRTRHAMHVQVRVPSLRALTLSGSGVVTASDLRARRLTVRLPGSGVVHVTGSAASLDAALDGSGDEQLGGLVARDVRARIGGSGRIVVAARESLRASISGSGAIFYAGNPAQVTRSITGSGAIQPGGASS
jgi:hypothetical protein